MYSSSSSFGCLKNGFVFAAIVVIFASLSGYVHGFSAKTVIDSPMLTEKVGTNRTIKVDINGDGDFTSVQEAINSVPEGNGEWVIIHIRKGVYREKVHIPKEKPYIFMRGNGRGKTAIVWSQSSVNNKASATFTAEAPHFIAFAPTILSLITEADITMLTATSRNCELFVIADQRVSIHGSITAQNREDEGDNSGFVFIKGKVYGIGNVYLGRAKGAYSRTIFAKTYLSKTIVPHGWTNWSYDGSTENLFQAEYKCHGPGAETMNRVPWSKQLTEEEADNFLSINFIDGKNWLPAYI
ncbi:hypothetical protein EZV62_000189 [Acer yangbiense]|uniref:pectinesterase n=1 Tax=Acer yangbiense TaxID=1000413 RepID=A0A5C7IQL2_9ROSI|nr:hypothetical protein EZV62_000189 [Acer yangbiense]